MAKPNILSNVQIRILLNFILGSTGLLLAAICLYSFVSAWTEASENQRTARIAMASQHLVQAYGDARIERGDILTGLSGDAPISNDMFERAAKKNKTVNDDLQTAVTALRQGDVAGSSPLLAVVRDSNAAVNALWARAETAAHQPKAQRPADLARTWDQTGNKLLDAILALSDTLESAIRGVDPQIDHLVAIKEAATMTRMSGGQAVLMMAPFLSGNQKFSLDQQLKEAGYRGEMASSWSLVKRLVAEPGTPQAIGDAVAQTEKEFFGQSAEHRLQVVTALAKGEPAGLGSMEWLAAGAPQLGFISVVGGEAMSAVVRRAEDRASTASNKLWFSGSALLLLSAYQALAARLVSQRVSKPLRHLTDAIARYAEQHYDAPIAAIDTRDELGRMREALGILAENGRQAQRVQWLRAEEQRQETERAKRVEELCKMFDDHMRDNLENVNGATLRLGKAATAMTTAAAQACDETQIVASASEKASLGISTVASATEELSSSVHEISRQTAQSTAIAADAVIKAERTNQAISSLATISEKIGEIVSLINGIASQTNLLALNATIEAARAGEAGKGFAVVATEVKSLANQTAKATEEITSQVQQIQSMTQNAVDGVREIGAVIQEMRGITTGIASAIEEQGAATQEIARNVNEVSMAARTISTGTAGLATRAEQSSDVAKEVTGATTSMEDQVNSLRNDVAHFLDDLRNDKA
ncbi:MAG TPA: HAMP domain-containing methyl-accepting chemotaxis protein [Telmatospirillum sp.]|nr:HAMP domain-containing methyl-accepting chemotaxis protein [Telmatospirillum sp.]